MAQGRMWTGFALLFAVVGTAAAQPPAYPGVGVGGPPGYPGMPAPMPPTFQPGGPPGAFLPAPPLPPALPPGSSSQTLSTLADDHPPMKVLPTDGLPELIPPPDKHHGQDDHEVPGWMTPFVPTHGGWFTGGEFLLMRPRNTDFDYAIRNSGGGLGTVGPIDSLKYGLGTGLRAEVGYRYGEGKWESVFAYTYFNGGGNATEFADGGGVLLPTLTRPGLTDRALTATANADLDYQLYDMLVGRRMMVDENFAIRWLGGFRFADIRQTFNAYYDGADARHAAVVTRSRFQGFGPLVGAEAVLGGWHGFHLYSRASAGLISGRDSNRVLETNDSGATTYVNTNYDTRKVVSVTSVAIGGGWQYRTFFFRAGYEITQWSGIFERPRFVDDVGQGKVITRPSNLTLEGLFLQTGLSF
jgi:hypothetical protein